jgi:hypothetical protein
MEGQESIIWRAKRALYGGPRLLRKRCWSVPVGLTHTAAAAVVAG